MNKVILVICYDSEFRCLYYFKKADHFMDLFRGHHSDNKYFKSLKFSKAAHLLTFSLFGTLEFYAFWQVNID